MIERLWSWHRTVFHKVSLVSSFRLSAISDVTHLIRVLLTGLLIGVCSGSAWSQDALAHVRLGLNGHFKTGRWTPVDVAFDAESAGRVALEILAPDPDGNIAITRGDVVQIQAPGPQRLSGFFRCGRLEGEVTVRVVPVMEEGPDPAAIVSPLAVSRLRVQTAGESHQPIEPLTVAYWLTVGNPAGVGEAQAIAGGGEDEARPVRVLEMESADALPSDVRGYDAVDVVVITGAGVLDEKRSAALQRWVQLGGHLVLALAEEAEAFSRSPVATWLPMEVRGVRTVNELSGLENFAGRSEKVDPLNTGRYRAADVRVGEGDVLIEGPQGSDSPLLARVAYGFGRVTFLAFDLNRAPLSKWSVLPLFVERMIEGRAGAAEQRRRQTSVGRLSHTGISELSTQLNAIQEHFPELRRFSAWSVLGLIALYLLIIGPLDYVLVHHVLKRPSATWITFPAFVVCAVLLSAWLSSRGGAGDAPVVNQVDIIDIDEKTSLVRAQSWITLYSPETRRYEVEVRPQAAFAGADSGFGLSWNGVPESVFGGMYRPTGLEFTRPRYAIDASAHVVEALPVAKSSTKSLRSAWSLTGAELADCELKGTTLGLLEGTIVHRLPVPIEDWLLAYGNRVFRPTARRGSDEVPSLQPFQRWQPNGPGVYQRELKGFLTRIKARRVEGGKRHEEDILVEQERYDALNLDPTDLVRMLTYHEATGGKGYTGLTNYDLERLDYSPLLGLDRAVLFGRIDMSAAQVSIDGRPIERGNKHAYVRILIPVKTREAMRYDLMTRPGAKPAELPISPLEN